MRKVIAFLLCVAMLLTSGMTVYASEIMEIDEMVYDSKNELFSDMRKIFKDKTTQLYEFKVTEELLKEVCDYDEIYRQYMFDFRVIFDFYGDQMGLPKDEGDYLEQQRYWSLTTSVNDYSYTIEIDTSGTKYCNTDSQESAFESKLLSLFASGGSLASVNGLSDSEKVVACMKYINANVTSPASNDLYNPLRHTAYSALCEGQATCQGKALLLYRMLRELGIPNRILMGVDASAHTYNIVMIDGKYYYTDPSTSNIILKGTSGFQPAALQEHYQTDAFKSGVLSKLSATDYPLKTEDTGNSGGESTGTQAPSTETPSTETPETPSTQTPGTGSTNTQTPSTETPSTGSSNTQNSSTGSSNTQNSSTGTTSTESSNAQAPDASASETPNVETKEPEYKMLDGADSTYDAQTQEFSLRAEADIEKFVSVAVDGQIVDPKYYTVKEGSTIVIFTKEFMDTLADGDHVVTFNFTDGIAQANIKVAVNAVPETEAVTEENTDSVLKDDVTTTGPVEDNKGGIPGFVWVILVLVIAAGGAGAFIWYKKKNKETSE